MLFFLSLYLTYFYFCSFIITNSKSSHTLLKTQAPKHSETKTGKFHYIHRGVSAAEVNWGQICRQLFGLLQHSGRDAEIDRILLTVFS